MRVVLASGSPRRKVLLECLLDRFDVVVTDVDETLDTGNVPDALEAVAHRKADAVTRDGDVVVLAADTAVLHDGQVLGKPADRTQARQTLHSLNGKAHQVVTAVAIHGPQGTQSFHVTSQVLLDAPPDVLDAYMESEQWQGKAGAYGIQDPLLAPCIALQGSWSNVVGLPLGPVRDALRAQGVACREAPDEDALRAENPF